MHAQLLKLCPILATLWTVTRQAPLSIGFSRQECWSELSVPAPGDLPDPGVEPTFPAQQEDSLLSYWRSPTRSIQVIKLQFAFLLLICLLLQGRLSQEPVSKKKIILPPEGKEQEGKSPLMVPQVILEQA